MIIQWQSMGRAEVHEFSQEPFWSSLFCSETGYILQPKRLNKFKKVFRPQSDEVENYAVQSETSSQEYRTPQRVFKKTCQNFKLRIDDLSDFKLKLTENFFEMTYLNLKVP